MFFALKEAITAAREEEALDPAVPFRMDSPATAGRIRVACVDRFTAQFPVPDDKPIRWNIEV